ncbi:MAG: TRAP transporter large permease [Aurantimonas endophytica]|uniref:TRAP transporter large permease protein n=1 Tax=Aurantimonas endophytica TaxID=1522175 RepID=A0A7W6HH06_9HYPH|nr:TRAP transporter large permease [Aurantimonas endophytica]MBB4005018.1 tripartite ATP-independent transporter DctM subunit [Aurantimonas endophytica]MCO6405824.1 TRAP transporter large permease subunit [Aurantimonas endophytica]
MSNLEIALLSFPILLALIFARMPIGLAMLVCGFVGNWIVMGRLTPILAQLKSLPFTTFASYSLSIIPLFLLMGQFAAKGGMSQALFRAANAWMGHRRGGVAMAAIGACAGFGAICGSSIATAATMGKVALPELKRYGYEGGFATGALAAGGTLGILIPPSVVLVIYAILTEQNIAKLFLAAFVPGILAMIGYMIAIAIYVRVKPEAAGTAAKASMAERLRLTRDVWPVLLVFFLVVFGIYFGWFTPTEGAAVGAAGTGLIAFLNGGLSRADLAECFIDTAIATAMIFFIILGAGVYNSFLALSQLPQASAAWVIAQGYSPFVVLTVILLTYLAFGCVMDSLSMILLTVPIFFPIVMGLDFGLPPEEFAIWFGILVLIVVEVGLITPPVGLNLFVINSMAKDTPMGRTYRGALPFVATDIVRTVILVLFPAITLFLVRWLY